MKIEPNEGKVVIKLAEKDEILSDGIYLPESSDESNRIGVVVWVNKKDNSWLAEGDKIVFSGYNEKDITIKDRKYIILENSKILGKLIKQED